MKRIKKILKISFYSFLGLIILGIIISSINNRIGNCQINGKIKGLGTNLALVTGGDNSLNNHYLKIVMVFNDRFSFRVKQNEPGGGRIITWDMLFKRKDGKPLFMRSKIIEFDLLPNQIIYINGFMKQYSISYATTGNKISEQLSTFREENLRVLENETKLALIIDSLKFNNSNKSLFDSSQTDFDNTRLEYSNKRLEYVLKNPNKELSASFLGMSNKDTLIKYLPRLGPTALATPSGQKLQERVRVYKQIEVGKLSPNITDGDKFKLSNLRGKYVVLDFWGTWCVPCVSGMRKMRTYYKKYKSKVEFVGIACNDKKSVWEKFLKEEGLQWTQLLNNPKKNDFIKKFNVRSFPTKIIVDREGKIVKTFEGETNSFYEKLDLLMNE